VYRRRALDPESSRAGVLTMPEFAYPLMFVLVPLPWLLRRWLPGHAEPRPAVEVPFMERLTAVSGAQPGQGAAVYRRSSGQWGILLLTWLCLVTALAKPQRIEAPIVKEEPKRDLLLALDLSGSMETQDFLHPDGSALSRLDAAKQVLDDFLTRREGDRVGLVLFGSAAFLQVPFTDDLELVRELLDEAQVRMLGPRTSLGDAMGLAITLFERSEVSERVLIALTDGNDTGSRVPPQRAAGIAADQGVVIHTVAMGDPAAVGEQALDEAALTEIAEKTGGRYFHAEDREELEGVYALLDELNPRQVDTASFRPRTDLYPWPLGMALVLSLLSTLPGALRQQRVGS
jgi:Ca-activated chloride channel family protein